ncbi:putative reverse transcriptase domain-containing protein [Tanacetum coccineum]
MSSSSAHSIVTYTSESDIDGSPWGIHLMPGSDSKAAEAAPHSLETTLKRLTWRIISEEEEEEEEELPALATSTPAIPDPTSPSEETDSFKEDETRLHRAWNSVRPQPPLPLSIDAHVEAWLAAPTPPSPLPSPLSPLSSPLPRIPRSTLAQGTIDGLVVAVEETNERVTDLGTRYRQDSHEMYVRHQDAPDDRAVMRACIASLEELQHQRQDDGDRVTRIIGRVRELERTRELERQDGPPDTGNSSNALLDFEANQNSRNGNGNDNGNGSHDSRDGSRRPLHTTNGCTTVGHDVAYEMPWKTLMKMMTETYCPRSEIKKLETELWNLTVKGSVMTSKPKMLQEAIELARSLMDQKVRAYPARQLTIKEEWITTQETTMLNNRLTRGKMWLGLILLGLVKRGSRLELYLCATSPRAIQRNVTCFECGIQGHYKIDCPKLKNKNRGNATGSGDTRGMAYALGGGEANPNLNVVTGMFLLNNHYAFILLDTSADRSFVSTTFSSLIDIAPSALDNSYDIELADKK